MNDSVAGSDRLHARVHEVIERVAAGQRAFGDALEFEALARDIACFQAAHVPGYARLLRARNLDPALAAPSALPAVPTDAFRLARIATFPPALERAVFRTSGTTQLQRGAHPMRRLDTYERAACVWADVSLLSRFAEPPAIVVIAPLPAHAADSSLGRMLEWLAARAPISRWCSPDDLPAVVEALKERSESNRPALVMATAFAWVHLLDHLAERPAAISLPAGSRAMQTGGFKGRTREVSAQELCAGITRSLGLSPGGVVGEYGMTELSSQLWAVPPLGEPFDGTFCYRAPPWCRVVACDPVTLAPLPGGMRGIARVEDLANVDSAWAVQTADEIVVQDDGAVVLYGRLPGSEPRGCSLAIEELVGS